MKKRKKWYEAHHEKCMAFRAQFGVTEGDGFKRLAAMKQGTEIEKALAETMEKIARETLMSADSFDAMVAAYAAICAFDKNQEAEDAHRSDRGLP